MTAARRAGWNFALDRAVRLAEELKKPLVVLETFALGRWAGRRHVRFVVQGMADQQKAFHGRPVCYYPFVEHSASEADDLAAALAKHAAAVVADDDPMREAQESLRRLADRADVPIEAIDGAGLLPMSAADRVFPVAHAFRRFLQKTLREHLLDRPAADPVRGADLPPVPAGLIPREIARRWPHVDPANFDDAGNSVPARAFAVDLAGGSDAARRTLDQFLRKKLPDYADERNHPDADATSGLSPYLHFGHVSVHEIFHALARREKWTPDRLAEKPNGKAEGWWGMSGPAESFLDELVTWREVGFNFCRHRDDYDRYDSLPDWAKATLAKHASDRRPTIYSAEQLERAQTHDALWNAAQTQLVREGRLHNYLRMLWGKKILEWSPDPKTALEILIDLNNAYSLDGCDPNSYSGIFWLFGRYDRPWGPERPIFGTVRYMSSDNTARKLRCREYVQRYSTDAESF